MFKNLMLYRLPANWSMTADKLDELLTPQAFAPCTTQQLQQQGWEAPRGAGLAHTVNKQILLKLVTEKKLLPASVINQVAKAKAAELEEAQGFAPGRKAMKEIKERVADELLPRAFPIRTSTFVWIDPVNGWLGVDTASTTKADDVIKLLLKSIDRMPIESLRVQRSPVAVMTDWLETDEAPVGFTVDQDTELRATGESRASVRYTRHALEVDDIRRHIAAGKQCTRLAMTWNSRISFVLNGTLAIKSIKALDVIRETEASTSNDEERFDNDMVLMTGELAGLLKDLVESLGGEAADLVSPAGAPAEPACAAVAQHHGDGPDPLYDQAVAIVQTHERASISLVQRHLRVGYNRAARLLEQMELASVVSAIDPKGARAVMAV